MPRKGRKRTKTRTHVVENETAGSALSTQEDMKVPHSLVVSTIQNTVWNNLLHTMIHTNNPILANR